MVSRGRQQRPPGKWLPAHCDRRRPHRQNFHPSQVTGRQSSLLPPSFKRTDERCAASSVILDSVRPSAKFPSPSPPPPQDAGGGPVTKNRSVPYSRVFLPPNLKVAWGNKTPGRGESIPSHIPATFQAPRSNLASTWRCRSFSVSSGRASTPFSTDDSRLACPAPRSRSPATPSPSPTPARTPPAGCRARTTAEMIAAGCSRIGKNCVNSYHPNCVNSYVPNARNDPEITATRVMGTLQSGRAAVHSPHPSVARERRTTGIRAVGKEHLLRSALSARSNHRYFQLVWS